MLTQGLEQREEEGKASADQLKFDARDSQTQAPFFSNNNDGDPSNPFFYFDSLFEPSSARPFAVEATFAFSFFWLVCYGAEKEISVKSGKDSLSSHSQQKKTNK